MVDMNFSTSLVVFLIIFSLSGSAEFACVCVCVRVKLWVLCGFVWVQTQKGTSNVHSHLWHLQTPLGHLGPAQGPPGFCNVSAGLRRGGKFKYKSEKKTVCKAGRNITRKPGLSKNSALYGAASFFTIWLMVSTWSLRRGGKRCVCVCVCVCERERVREREWVRERELT